MITVALAVLAEKAKIEGTNWLLVYETETHRVFWAEWDKNYWDSIYKGSLEDDITSWKELISDYPDGETLVNYKIEKKGD